MSISKEHIAQFIEKAREIFEGVSLQRHHSFEHLMTQVENKREVILISRAQFSDKSSARHEVFERYVTELGSRFQPVLEAQLTFGEEERQLQDDAEQSVMDYLEEYEDQEEFGKDEPRLGTPGYIVRLQNRKEYTLDDAVQMGKTKLNKIYKQFCEENPIFKASHRYMYKSSPKGYIINLFWRTDISVRECVEVYG